MQRNTNFGVDNALLNSERRRWLLPIVLVKIGCCLLDMLLYLTQNDVVSKFERLMQIFRY